MGKSNSKNKPKPSELRGCARVMWEKHGKHTCEQLPLWVEKFGFPENGSFSVRKIQKLQERLEEHGRAARSGRREVDWAAFQLWRMEAETRQRSQEEGRRRSEQREEGRRRGEQREQGRSHQEPRQEALPAAAAPQEPPHEEERGQPAEENQETALCPYEPQDAAQTGSTSLVPRSSQTPQTSHSVQIYDPSDQSRPGAVLVYVYRAWMPEELRSVAADMPDAEKHGGAAFVEVLLLVVQLYRPSLWEIRSLLLHRMKLQLLRLQADWPLADLSHDWTPGCRYREFVQELCGKTTATFKGVDRFDLISACRQKPGEDVDDFFTRFTEVFKENCGIFRQNNMNSMYGYLFADYFVQGLDKEIGEQIRENVIGWSLLRPSLLLAHAAAIERNMRAAEEKRQKAREQQAERLQQEVLRALRGASRRGGRGRRAGRRDNRCWCCGAPGHFARDCYFY